MAVEGNDAILVNFEAIGGGTGPFQQVPDGTVSMEAENFDNTTIVGGAEKSPRSLLDASGGLDMQAPDDNLHPASTP